MLNKFYLTLFAISGVFLAECAGLQLTTDGETGYAIVAPEKPSEVDNYAIKILEKFLKEKTGAKFSVVTPDKLPSGGKHIFVGLSAPVLKVIGKEDPLAVLKDQEYVVRSTGDDILLYGKGIHGNLHAVLDFMETTLGRRWYTDGVSYGEAASKREPLEGEPVFTVERNLIVKPFDRKGGFAFAYRIAVDPRILQYQHGLNMGFSERRQEFKKAYGTDPFSDGVESLKFMPLPGHTLFSYIPPDPKADGARAFDWLKKKDYFITNRDFFSKDKTGNRVVDQLCFSNPALRAELTKNVLEHIRILNEQGYKNPIIDVSAMDNSTQFCFCLGCQELKKKYQAVGGPIYDYLFELCAVVKKQHPDTMIHTLAYRLSQTQKPPVMPSGQAFPENLIVQFAPVEDNVDADWNSPVNRPSYDDLLAWGKLTPHIWIYYYPNTFASSGIMPSANIERRVTDLRLMKKAGVEGVYNDASYDTSGGYNFTELQKYIYIQLLKDIDRDVVALIQEFTDYQYGLAAPLTRTYLKELEEAQKAASHDKSMSAGKGIGRVITGLTPKILLQWQGYFDQMEKATAADPLRLKNVKRLRQTLDYATLAHWNDLTKAYPDYFSDYLVVKNRLAPTPPGWGYNAAVEDWEMVIKTGGIEKPLPAPFDTMDKTLVRRFVPGRSDRAPNRFVDTDAAFGYAGIVDKPDKPFKFGFYQNDTEKRGATSILKADDIEPNIYRIYKLGEIQVTPDCIIWFSVLSWVTQLQLGERLYSPPAPDNDNRYDVYVSLKFDGPAYGGKAKDNLVLCDQIIFVKKPVKQ